MTELTEPTFCTWQRLPGGGQQCTVCKWSVALDLPALRRSCPGTDTHKGEPIRVPRKPVQVVAKVIEESTPKEGPGTELTALLAELGLDDKRKDCQSCKAKAALMNRWGVDGCKKNRAVIVAWLEESAKRASWGEWWKAGRVLVKQEWFSPLDPYGSIVDEAIRRAEVKQKD